MSSPPPENNEHPENTGTPTTGSPRRSLDTGTPGSPRRSQDLSFSAAVQEQSPDGTTHIRPILKHPSSEDDLPFRKRKKCPESCEEHHEHTDLDQSDVDESKLNAENTEFVYYTATLREVAPRLTNNVDRQGCILWLRKLFRPEYHSSRFRSKRNKFLLYLTLTLMNDEMYGLFREMPPTGALPNFETIPSPELVSAEWERDTMWHDVLQGVPKTHQKMECSVHVTNCQCEGDTFNSALLDEEFTYLLYLARPFAALLPNPEDRTKIAAWLQTLCTIQKSSCSAMKYIRNDYITALLGYIHELRVAGPFSEFPTWDPLPPLAEAVRILSESYPNIDPCQTSVDDFFCNQPVPEEGAFCFLAITGEMIESSMENLN